MTKETWQVLDSYEASELHALTVDEKLEARDLSNRLAKLEFTWGRQFQKLDATFESQVVRLQSGSLGPVTDSEPFLIPTGCQVLQAAIQFNGRYLIDQSIWNSLSPFERKILRSHEILDRVLLQNRELQNSRPVRALTALLWSQEFSTWSKEEINQFRVRNDLVP